MQSIYSTQAFEAFRTENGITIQPKSGSTKKMSMLITFLGTIFVGISFIDLNTLLGGGDHPGDFVRITGNISFYVFRWGGILLLILGVLLFLLKNLPNLVKPIIVDAQQKQVIIRDKPTPFAEISEVTHQTQKLLGKNMTLLMMVHQGKKKPFVPGTFIIDNQEALEKFLVEVNQLVKSA